MFSSYLLFLCMFSRTLLTTFGDFHVIATAKSYDLFSTLHVVLCFCTLLVDLEQALFVPYS